MCVCAELIKSSSTVYSVYIFRHSDKLHIFAGNSNEEDIWGMEEFQFILGNCGRCTKTFIRGPTAFVANINGPVRAIR